ncbi:pilus assembly PilX N-terminal domain-containing protein [Amphibacillus cookii]|uniref:pilus assembly PilX N-terminal domain-containing protein n=1 Tax=Amphibacillus cookii TaxID=767787 RepID=UPI00195E8CF8|nr:pilus assembly PilX N-terminal domain-containing protein [Amphibacillus cookii]MBM7541794.1 hypothetical protein [Amphibacillus cookii]
MKKLMNEESGVTLLFVLMTLVVLSILGVALATVAFANVKLTTTDREYQSTYYIAEAGVNQAYAEIKGIVEQAYDVYHSQEQFYQKMNERIFEKVDAIIYKNFESHFGEEPLAEIEIIEINQHNPRQYKIISKGQIGSRNRSIEQVFTVNWSPKDSGSNPQFPEIPEDMLALVRSKINLSGSVNLNGDIYLSSDDHDVNIQLGAGSTINGNLYAQSQNNINLQIREMYGNAYLNANKQNTISFTNGGMMRGNLYAVASETNTFSIRAGAQLNGTAYFRGKQGNIITTQHAGITQDIHLNPSNNNVMNIDASLKGDVVYSEQPLIWDDPPSDFKGYEDYVNAFPDIPSYTQHENIRYGDESEPWNQYDVIKDGDLLVTTYHIDSYTLQLNNNYAFNKVQVGNGKSLYLDTAGQDREIVIDDLSLNGDLVINGNGHVNIYVKNHISLANHINITSEEESTFTIYYENSRKPIINGNIEGSLFVKQANLEFAYGSTISGSVISGGDQIIFNSTSDGVVLIAPYATLIPNNVPTKGFFVVDTISGNGGGSIELMGDLDIFIPGRPNDDQDVDVDLITKEPPIEQND